MFIAKALIVASDGIITKVTTYFIVKLKTKSQKLNTVPLCLVFFIVGHTSDEYVGDYNEHLSIQNHKKYPFVLDGLVHAGHPCRQSENCKML